MNKNDQYPFFGPGSKEETDAHRMQMQRTVVVEGETEAAQPAVAAQPTTESPAYEPVKNDEPVESTASETEIADDELEIAEKQPGVSREEYEYNRAKELGRASIALSILALLFSCGGVLCAYFIGGGIPLSMSSDWFFPYLGGAVLGFCFGLPALLLGIAALKRGIKSGIAALVMAILAILVAVAAAVFFALAYLDVFVLPAIKK